MWEDAPQVALLNDILEQTNVGGRGVLELFRVEKMWFFPTVKKVVLDWARKRAASNSFFSQSETSSGSQLRLKGSLNQYLVVELGNTHLHFLHFALKEIETASNQEVKKINKEKLNPVFVGVGWGGGGGISLN